MLFSSHPPVIEWITKAHVILGLGLRVRLNSKNLNQWDPSISSNMVILLYTRVGPGHLLILCGVRGGIQMVPIYRVT